MALKFGASGTDPLLESRGVLNTLSGSAKAGQQAMDFANQLYPDLPEADPWEAAFQFFAEMGKQASQPGATVLGSAVGSMQAPMDYLNAKKKEKRETDRARMQTAVSLAPSLKPAKATGSGTSVMVVDPETGNPRYMSSAEAIRTGAEPYIAPKSGSANDLKPFGLIDPDKLAEIQRVVPSASVDASGNVLLTDVEAAMAGVRPYIGQKVTPDTSDSGNKPLTELAKLYDDLNSAEEGSEEATNIQQQIDALARQGGFNKEIFGAEADLRKEWKKFETPYDEIEIKHQKLVSSLKRQSGVGDMSAIFVYMKMLDPGSVVRESEFAQAQQTAGAVESLIVKMNQIAVGEKLSPEQRTEFLALAEEFRNLSKSYVGQNRLDLGAIVSNNTSLKPSNIFGSELAPANFYLDTNVYRQANSLGFSMDEVWEGMTDEEKADYLPSEDN
jgi:hypothetical protein|tara:strand:+ start:290 stop:1618 length:1329 start_codon:yes stop_codon:yes gene_type:complete